METYVIVILLLVLAVVLLVGALVWTRKEAKRDLARHQQELELLVHERTAELMITNTCLEQEIAQRKRLEEKLTIFSRAIEQSPIAITITDTDGIINYINPKFVQQSGFSADDVCGRQPRVLTKIPRSPEADQLWKAIRAGTEWHGELQNTSKSGSKYWESGVVSPIVDLLGHVTHVVAMMQDVTHLKQQEREQEAMLAVASALRTVGSRAEMLPVILQQVCVSLEATLAFCTAPAAADGRLLIEAACKEGACSCDLTVPLPPAESPSAVTRCGGEPWRTDDLTDGTTGDPFLAGLPLITDERAAACAPLVAQDTVIGFLWVARTEPLSDSDLRLLSAIANMTATGLQRAALHEQSLRNAADLEREVAERTRELLEANQRLQELDKLKSKFVSDVSHELRTPVTNVGLYLQLMELKPHKSAHYLSVLREQASRLEMLVTEVLDLSRLDNTQELEMAPVNLDEVLAAVVAAQVPHAEARGLSLTFEPGPQTGGPAYGEGHWVLGDGAKLMQVVTNLVANAVNYTRTGHVWVRSGSGAAPDTVQFTVEDTGIGIYPEDIPHLFERFYRGRRDQAPDVPGSGLGLVIVKELVDRHTGSIGVQSRVGAGTTFTVTLPAAAAAELHAAPAGGQ